MFIADLSRVYLMTNPQSNLFILPSSIMQASPLVRKKVVERFLKRQQSDKRISAIKSLDGSHKKKGLYMRFVIPGYSL